MCKKMKINIILFALFLFCLSGLYSLEITEIEAAGWYRGVHTRSLDFVNEFSAIGTIELEDKYTFKGGLAYGRSLSGNDINTLVNATWSPFEHVPLGFSVTYFYNGLPQYETHTNSIFPYVSWEAKRYGFSVGCTFRFTRFFRESAQYEPVLTFNGYVNFINIDAICIGFGFGNYDTFHVGSVASFSPKLYAKIRLDDNWQITNDIEVMQSGADGLTTTLYGIAFRTGVKYSW